MKKDIILITISAIVSVVSGLLTHDLLFGGLTLFTGLLCSYFATEGKRVNYILGFINYLLMGYVAYKNHFFGTVISYYLIFSPLQVIGFIMWRKKLVNKKVIVRTFTPKVSVLVTLICISGGFITGYFLNFIPTVQLAFLDATSQCINFCGVVLMNLRYKECWWVWLANNILDLFLWTFAVINHGDGAIMLLLVSIGYTIINIFGIIKWQKAIKKERLNN